MADDTVRELPHTADIGFEVRASSLDRLFQLAARGLAEALGVEGAEEGPAKRGAGGEGPSEKGAGAERAREPRGAGEEPLELERPDLERLLVSWLRELLHRSAAERRVPEVNEVRVTGPREDRPAGLSARIRWREATSEPVREIKGVTYHGLEVRLEEGVWHAKVVLDV